MRGFPIIRYKFLREELIVIDPAVAKIIDGNREFSLIYMVV